MKTLSNQIKELSAEAGSNHQHLVALIDEKGNVQFINSYLVSLLGLDSEHIKDINLFSFIQPQDLEAFRNVIDKARKEGQHLSADIPLKNGSLHAMNWQVTSLSSIDKFLCIGYKQTDQPIHTGNAAANPSQHKTALSYINNSDYKAFLENSPRFAWILNEKNQIVYANKSLLAHFGTSLEAIQKNIYQLLSKQVLEVLISAHDNSRKNKTFFSSVFRSPRADRNGRVFKVTTFPIGHEQIAGEAEDITVAWQREEELKRMNERLLYIMQATTEATWEWDIPSGQVTRNITLQDMIGFPNEQKNNVNWWVERIHPEDKKKLEEKIANVFACRQQSWELEYRFLHADGKYITLYDKGYVVYENELPVKSIGSLQDVTEIKKLETQLVKEKLDRQEKIAEAIIEAQEEERTRLGHELHDNVNQVLTTAKLYLETITSANEKDAVIINKTKAFIMDAINEIRNFSKTMVLPQLKGNTLAESIRKLLEEIEMTGFYDIDFSYHSDINSDLPERKKITLFRIIQEQVKNIIKHSEAKKISIRLQITRKEVKLHIQDDGIGFDPSEKRKGIGLGNINDRVELYKGKVELKTAPGKGCGLFIEIPL